MDNLKNNNNNYDNISKEAINGFNKNDFANFMEAFQREAKSQLGAEYEPIKYTSEAESDRQARDDLGRGSQRLADRGTRDVFGYERGRNSELFNKEQIGGHNSLLDSREMGKNIREGNEVLFQSESNSRQYSRSNNRNSNQYTFSNIDRKEYIERARSEISSRIKSLYNSREFRGYVDEIFQRINSRIAQQIRRKTSDLQNMRGSAGEIQSSLGNHMGYDRQDKEIGGQGTQGNIQGQISGNERGRDRGIRIRTREHRDGGVSGVGGESSGLLGGEGERRGYGEYHIFGNEQGGTILEGLQDKESRRGTSFKSDVKSNSESGFRSPISEVQHQQGTLFSLQDIGEYNNTITESNDRENTQNSREETNSQNKEYVSINSDVLIGSQDSNGSSRVYDDDSGNRSYDIRHSAGYTQGEITQQSQETEKIESLENFKTFTKNQFFTRLDGIEYKGEIDFNLTKEQRIEANTEAIKLTQTILSENRLTATPEEQNILAKFSGFGGLRSFFTDDKYNEQRQEIENILGSTLYRQISETTQTAYYTPKAIINTMYEGLKYYGLSNDNIDNTIKIRALEPSCGIGHFMTLAPENFEFEAVEKDIVTATIAKLLHPKARIYNQGFEDVEFLGKFDVVIGNPPYSDEWMENDTENNVSNKELIHNFFVLKSQDLLKDNGLSSFVITSGFMDSKRNAHREQIAQNNYLLKAIRLSNDTFSDTDTSVLTDVVFFMKSKKDKDHKILKEYVAKKYNKAYPSNINQSSFVKFFTNTIIDYTNFFIKASEYLFENNEKIVMNDYFTKILDKESIHNKIIIASSTTSFAEKDNFTLGKNKYGNNAIIFKAGDSYNNFILNPNQYVKTEHYDGGRFKNDSFDEVCSVLYDIEPSPYNKVLNEIIELNILDMQKEKREYVDKLRIGNIFELDNIIYEKTSDNTCKEVYFEEQANKEIMHLVDKDLIIQVDKTNFIYKNRPNEKEVKILKDIIAYRDLLKENIVNERYLNNDDESNKLIMQQKQDLRLLREKILLASNAKALNAQQNNIYDGKKSENGRVLRHSIKKIIELERLENYRIFATENIFKKAKKNGFEKYFEIADILKKRVLYPLEKTLAKTPIEALQKTINEVGTIKLETLQSYLPDKPLSDTLKELCEQDLIYPNLDTRYSYVLKPQFLTGNIKEKYNKIQEMINNNEAFDLPYALDLSFYAERLKENFPKYVYFEDLEVSFGSSFVDIDIYETFIKDSFFNIGNDEVIVKINRLDSEYIIEDFCKKTPDGHYEPISFSDMNETGQNLEVKNEKQKTYFDLCRLIGNVLNSSSLEVCHYEEDIDGKRRRVVESVPTKIAIDNAENIKDMFREYLFDKKHFKDRIQERYNNEINVFSQVKLEYINYLNYTNMNKDITLRKHQDNAVFKGIINNAMLYDHQVGAGKTLVAIALTMEQIRMGLIKKALILVPNHLCGQWSQEFLKAYPNANILVGDRIQSKKDRKEFLYRSRNGDFDAIIMKHSTFENINVMETFQARVIQNELSALENTLKIDDENRIIDPKLKQSIIDKQNKLQRKLTKSMKASKSFDDEIAFEDLGIDCLIVDEAHNFKNLMINTRQRNIRGLPLVESKKALKMYSATQYIHNNNGFKLYFLTGTPVSNSIAEFYIMQKYIQPEVLNATGLSMFDDWQKSFSRIVLSEELDSSGVNYALVSRLSKFINTPELMGFYKQNADIITNDDIEKISGKIVPNVKGGKAINVVVPRSDDIAKFIGVEDEQGNYNQGSIIWRMNNFNLNPRKNNVLACTSEARKAALDFRLINPNANDYEDSKINHLVANVLKHYNDDIKYPKNTQLVFCDLGISKENSQKIDVDKPNISQFLTIEDIVKHYNLEHIVEYDDEGKEKRSYWVEYEKEKEKKSNDDNDENKKESKRKIVKTYDYEQIADILDNSFDVYSEILRKLVKAGIPQNQIAFIGDATTDNQKQTLFDKVNEGMIRVLIGSTQKMGAGTNVQQRVIAMHELDCPWRPADLEQRAGRVIRQGNLFFEQDKENFEITHYRYATEQTYDARMFQINEQKLLPLIQIKKSENLADQRVFDSIDSEMANIADMKAYATGNPFILEKHKIKQLYEQEERYKNHHLKAYQINERALDTALEKKEAMQERVDILREMSQNKGFEKDNYEIEILGIKTTKKPRSKDEEKAFYELKDSINEKIAKFERNPMAYTQNSKFDLLNANGINLSFEVSERKIPNSSGFFTTIQDIVGVITTSSGKEYRPNNLVYTKKDDLLNQNEMSYDGILTKIKNLFSDERIKQEISFAENSSKKIQDEILSRENFLNNNKTYDREVFLKVLKQDMLNIDEAMRIRNEYRKQGIKIMLESEEIKHLLPKYKMLLNEKEKFVEPQKAKKILNTTLDTEAEPIIRVEVKSPDNNITTTNINNVEGEAKRQEAETQQQSNESDVLKNQETTEYEATKYVDLIDNKIAQVEKAIIDFEDFSGKKTIDEKVAVLVKNQENIIRQKRSKSYL